MSMSGVLLDFRPTTISQGGLTKALADDPRLGRLVVSLTMLVR